MKQALLKLLKVLSKAFDVLIVVFLLASFTYDAITGNYTARTIVTVVILTHIFTSWQIEKTIRKEGIRISPQVSNIYPKVMNMSVNGKDLKLNEQPAGASEMPTEARKGMDEQKKQNKVVRELVEKE